MRRREFLGLLGTGTAWPMVAHTQPAGLSTVGFLDSRTSDGMASRLAGFRRGLKEIGLVEGENVSVAYGWAEDQHQRLPALAADLVHQGVSVIVTTGGPPAAFAARAATTTVPVVFLVGGDPTELGLVSSLARPTGNLTGVNLFNTELESK